MWRGSYRFGLHGGDDPGKLDELPARAGDMITELTAQHEQDSPSVGLWLLRWFVA